MKLLIILALFLVITLLQVYDAEGKTLWGARKKKENEDRSNSKSNKPKIDDILQQRQGRSRNSRISRNNEKAEVNSQVKELFDTYLVKLEELIDSEDLATLVDPNMIKPLLDQIALFSPESKSMFDEINWDDLDLNAYRDSLKESVRLIKDNSEQIFQILNDPNAMEQYTSMLPEEVKDIFSALQRGEVDSLADLVSKIPGMDNGLEMLKKLMDVEPSDLGESMKSILTNTDYMEEARKQFLNSPEMAEALGIPIEVLQDPKRWAQLMAENMDALSNVNGNVEMEAPKPRKRFSRSA